MCLTIFPKGCGEDPVAKGAVSHFKFYQMYCKAAFFFLYQFSFKCNICRPRRKTHG